MPFQSAKQRRYLHARHPEMAKKWEAEAKKKRTSAVKRKSTGKRKGT